MALETILSNINEMISEIDPDAAAVPVIQQSFSIFRVPAHIRSYKNNELYFEPRVISIGPYHWGKGHLDAMELHKRRYLHEFFEKGGTRREEYIKRISGLVPSIRKCYFESIKDHTDEKLAEMMLLDGCFILQLLIKLKNGHDLINDPVFRASWNLPLIFADLLMVENQIPFSVLKNLYEMYSYEQSPKPCLDDLLLNFVKQVEDRRKAEVVINYKNWLEQTTERNQWDHKIHHLLHFYYVAYIPVLGSAISLNGTTVISRVLSCLTFTACRQRESSSSEEARRQEETHPRRENIHTEEIDLHRMDVDLHQLEEARRLEEIDSSKKTMYPRMIPCATELEQLDVMFKKHKRPKNFMDIRFVEKLLTRPILEIPCITIEGETKPKFMNLVAFEQSSGMENKHMTCYALFMVYLLQTREDVIVLQNEDIIKNKMANEEEVVKFFRQLHGSCYIKFDQNYYAPMLRAVNAYCQSMWSKLKARVYRECHKYRWPIISLCLGIPGAIFGAYSFCRNFILHQHQF